MKSSIVVPTLCVATLLSLGFLVGGPAAVVREASADGRSDGSSQPVTDAWITTRVKSELATTKGVTSTDVSVTTADGTVTLTGVLADDVAVKKAVAAAKSVKGVRSVDSSGLKAKD